MDNNDCVHIPVIVQMAFSSTMSFRDSARAFEHPGVRFDFVATSWTSLHPAAARDVPSCGWKYPSSTPGDAELPAQKNQLLTFAALVQSVGTFDFYKPSCKKVGCCSG